MGANKTPAEKARWERLKDAKRCFEQIGKQHLTKGQLYGHFPPILQTIQKMNKTSWTLLGKVRTNS